MAPGTKLMSPDGVIGIVTPNNTISLTLPPDYSQRVTATHLHCKSSLIQLTQTFTQLFYIFCIDTIS